MSPEALADLAKVRERMRRVEARKQAVINDGIVRLWWHEYRERVRDAKERRTP